MESAEIDVSGELFLSELLVIAAKDASRAVKKSQESAARMALAKVFGDADDYVVSASCLAAREDDADAERRAGLEFSISICSKMNKMKLTISSEMREQRADLGVVIDSG